MMTAILVDSNVLLDMMMEGARWLSWSADAVEKRPIGFASLSTR
jgi:hypothetical protein